MTDLGDRMNDWEVTIHQKKSLVPDFYRQGIAKADNRTKRVIGAIKVATIKAELDPIFKELVNEWGDQAFDDMNVKPQFDMYNENVKTHLEDFSSDRITQINDTTRDRIAEVLGQGVEAGEGIDDLAVRVNDVFDTASSYRGELVARTEVTRSANFATLEGYKQTGLVSKKAWLATPDDITRDTHAQLGIQPPIPIDEPFEVYDASAMYPGDFGIPEEDCNCRCSVTPVADDVPGDDELLDGDAEIFGDKRARGVSKKPRFMTAEARWKRFDKALLPWEAKVDKAMKKAFAEQKAAALAALRV